MKKLIDKAKDCMNHSHSPYSKFKVGASILLKDGNIISGTNVENISYGLTMCAERVALFNTISQGYKKDDIESICVVGNTKKPIAPCGACLQVMYELLRKDTKIVLACSNEEVKITTIEELLPYGFSEVK